MQSDLIRKYNIPGPRYTSYPTVPYWESESLDQTGWQETVARAFAESNADEGISLARDRFDVTTVIAPITWEGATVKVAVHSLERPEAR